jgi:hypothetical protein
MIRSTLSFCALFGALILGSKLLQESSSPRPAPAKTLGDAASPRQSQPAEGNQPAATAERVDSVRPARFSGSAPAELHFISFDEPAPERPRDPDDNDAPPRPTRALEDLLKDEPALETPPAEKPVQSEAEEESAGKDKSTSSTDSANSAAEKSTEKSTDKSTEKSAEPELTPELAELRERVRQCLAW